ncbi:response regulator transcription factor [Jeotgalicoccus sp. S0W5]|uniref:response regulator transcription factor n=1 Tax=Jeotgalicoccus sp. S0W5 TaxID=2527874 RepID=UPI001414D80D|nr:response regulator transcription factor [Jeotgalicoccus sp. S0W5]
MKDFNILIVEDDISSAENLKKILVKQGARVSLNHTGEHVLEQLTDVHLILLDIMLPYDDGLSIADYIHQHVDIPIIFLTARNDMDSKITGLRAGDDYITKPFHPTELISRINNILGRFYDKTQTTLFNLTIDPYKFEVFDKEDNEIQFTKIEKRLFFYLFSNIGSTLTKEQILQYVWPDGDTYDNSLNVYIKKIRQKINDHDNMIISTIHGIGYRMNAHEK